MFKIGDKISYPMHGAGVIQDIETKDILGEERKYYILKLPYNDMDVMIPIDNCKDIGIRPVVSKEEMDEAMEVLAAESTPMQKNWNKRQRDNLDKLKTGNVSEVAEVVRNLLRYEREKGLSAGEKRMLANARQIFESELLMVLDVTSIRAAEIVEETV